MTFRARVAKCLMLKFPDYYYNLIFHLPVDLLSNLELDYKSFFYFFYSSFLTAGKMVQVPGLARATERKTNLSILLS